MNGAPASTTGAVRGVAAAALAAVLFAAIFYLSGAVDVSAEAMFGARILLTFACYALALLHPAPRRLLREYWDALRRIRGGFLLLPVLCALVGVQLWLFSWAPLHGHALDASLGFLLLPLTIVLGGRIVLGARATRLQWLAVTTAAVAVGVKVALTPQVSWVTFVICTGYPIYFVLRRRFGLDNAAAFGVETALLAPIAVVLVWSGAPLSTSLFEGIALLSVGVAGAAAMAAYLAAARLLSLPVFGLLGYLEPVLLVIVAVLLGERPHGGDLVVYGLLAAALVLLSAEGLLRRSTAEFTPPRDRDHRSATTRSR